MIIVYDIYVYINIMILVIYIFPSSTNDEPRERSRDSVNSKIVYCTVKVVILETKCQMLLNEIHS